MKKLTMSIVFVAGFAVIALLAMNAHAVHPKKTAEDGAPVAEQAVKKAKAPVEIHKDGRTVEVRNPEPRVQYGLEPLEKNIRLTFHLKSKNEKTAQSFSILTANPEYEFSFTSETEDEAVSFRAHGVIRILDDESVYVVYNVRVHTYEDDPETKIGTEIESSAIAKIGPATTIGQFGDDMILLSVSDI